MGVCRLGQTGIFPHPWKLALRAFKEFCESPFALKPERDKQNVDVAPPLEKLLRSRMPTQ